MLNSRPVRLLWHSFNWLTRLTLITSMVTVVLGAIIIIALRYWLLPGIEQFHNKISSSLSAAIGNPVSIGKITGDWDGLHPHLNFNDVRILDNAGQAALELPRVEASLSWLSLLAAELRLTRLEIDRPELLIRRDTQGKIYIGSVALASENASNDLSNWLLHQSRMVVRNAVIVWQDEQRGAPPLVLDQVNLRIENLYNHHQFALRAVPPLELSTPLDLRGDFHGRNFDQLNKWNGSLYTQLDYTDLLAWRPWLNLPPQLSSGRGALRGWLGIDGGKLTRITADLALLDVATRLSDDVPKMEVNYLRGRTTWNTRADGWDIDTRNLTMRLHNGFALQPTDFYFRSTQASPSQLAGGQLRANQLQLESLVSLANFLPLDTNLRNQLIAYAPRGQVSDLDMDWQGTAAQVSGYKIKGKFVNLSLQQVGQFPGFSGLSVEVNGSQAGGNLNINTRNLTLDAPGVLREPLLFHTLTGQVNWQHKSGELAIRLANVALSNDDLAGNLYGSFETRANTLGMMDITASLTRGEIKHAARYIPFVALDKKDNDWLNTALLSGHTEDFHLRLKGNLSDFPLNGTTDSSFKIDARAQDVSMEYAAGWPKIEKLSGEFTIDNNRLEVHAPTATVLGARITKLSVIQSDMSQTDAALDIQGEAEASNNVFLQFIQQSPVRGYINGFTDGVSASGNGHLDLTLKIPLTGKTPAKVAGLFSLGAADIDLGAGAPWLRNTQGELAFTETGMKSNTVTTDMLGGPATLNIETAEGGLVRANLQGRCSLDVLRNIDKIPLPDALQGSSGWNADISIVNKVTRATFNSSLQGISSTLPAPLNKAANEGWPLHIEKKNSDEKQELISVQLGHLLSARFLRSTESGASQLGRGRVHFGEPDATTNDATLKPGLWLTGRLPALSLQGWNGLTGKSGKILPVDGANLHIDNLTGFGLHIKDLNINAAKRGDGLAAQLSSLPVNGEIVWQPQGYNGTPKLSARLHNLYLIKAETDKSIPLKSGGLHPDGMPAIDVSIEDLLLRGKNIGNFELTGFPEGADWRLRRLHISNPDGSLTGEGLWREGATGPLSQFNVLLQISNAGQILARSGYPDTVKNGSGKLNARLSWEGQPYDFNYATLAGTLKLDTGKGQFLKMEPGIGKLLGILSLQALPKRITLDFADIFSAGFEFDNINGNATIEHGILHTEDLHIDGSSAKVTMKGQVNLNDETQNLQVEVLPTLGSSISMLSAFTAGPVVGLSTLIVSKLLGNPLDKLMSFEYNVSGTWSEPNVVKLGEKPVVLQNQPKKPTDNK